MSTRYCLLSSDPDRQGDFGEQAVKAQIDNLDRARSIAGGIAAKFRTYRDPGGHPAFGFRRSSGPRPILEPDPDGIAAAVLLFELYASGLYSDDTLALDAARRGLVSRRTGRVLTAAGMAELLRNPIYTMGLKWARNRVAHGVVVSAPIEPRIYGSEPGLAILGVSMLGSASRPARWLPRSATQLGPRDRRNQTEEQAYDAHVAGQPLIDVLDRAIAIAR